MTEKLALKTCKVITPLIEIKDCVIFIENNMITGIDQGFEKIPKEFSIIDLREWILVPGFIDIHNHGGMGKMVDEGGFDTIQMNCKRLPKTGCTAWLPTVDSKFGCEEIVRAIKENPQGARVAGIHMEGPFLTPKDIDGINGIDYGVEKPTIEKFQELFNASQGHLKIMGVSVELEGIDPIISELNHQGVVPAIAHSTRATYEQFMRGVLLGISHVTHTYNVMTGLHQRRPGVLGGALTYEAVTNEIISDGYHVSPVAIDILIRCKGKDQVCIITDNTSVAGLPDGEYEMAGAKIVKAGGITRYANSTDELDHTMAGSEWPINHNIQVMVRDVGIELKNAIQMATLNPSRVIGMDKTLGSIEIGKCADIVAIDKDINVHLAIIDGNVYYDPNGLVNNNS